MTYLQAIRLANAEIRRYGGVVRYIDRDRQGGFQVEERRSYCADLYATVWAGGKVEVDESHGGAA